MQSARTEHHSRRAAIENVIWVSLLIAILSLLSFLILSALWQDLVRLNGI